MNLVPTSRYRPGAESSAETSMRIVAIRRAVFMKCCTSSPRAFLDCETLLKPCRITGQRGDAKQEPDEHHDRYVESLLLTDAGVTPSLGNIGLTSPIPINLRTDGSSGSRTGHGQLRPPGGPLPQSPARRFASWSQHPENRHVTTGRR